MKETRSFILVLLVISGFFIALYGSLWHNWYSMTQNNIVGYIAPVNESVWEHTKLITFPFLVLFTTLWILSIIFKFKLTNPITALFASTILGIFITIFLFYGYNNIDRGHNLLTDIFIYYGAITFGLLLMGVVLTRSKENTVFECLSTFLYIILLILTFLWTYNPPCDCSMWESPEMGEFDFSMLFGN
jgi:hypothetical protein